MTPDSPSPEQVYLPDIVGRGYREFWDCRKRYRVVKGGKASKKSCTAALQADDADAESV